MNIIAKTELILTPENKIYHLNLSKDQIEKVCLLGELFDGVPTMLGGPRYIADGLRITPFRNLSLFCRFKVTILGRLFVLFWRLTNIDSSIIFIS